MQKTLAAFLLLAAPAASQVRHLNPDGLSKPTGYTHVVGVKARETFYIAGQVAQNAKGEIVGAGDLRAQTEQVFENLRIALAAAGCSFADVVKMNTYIVNYRPENVTVVREVRAKYLGSGNPPASTLAGVQSLARSEYMIEIEAVAVKK